MNLSFTTITCPSCLQQFEVAVPTESELPTDLDYDCEICCRPMFIHIDLLDDTTVWAEARGIND